MNQFQMEILNIKSGLNRHITNVLCAQTEFAGFTAFTA